MLLHQKYERPTIVALVTADINLQNKSELTDRHFIEPFSL